MMSVTSIDYRLMYLPPNIPVESSDESFIIILSEAYVEYWGLEFEFLDQIRTTLLLHIV